MGFSAGGSLNGSLNGESLISNYADVSGSASASFASANFDTISKNNVVIGGAFSKIGPSINWSNSSHNSTGISWGTSYSLTLFFANFTKTVDTNGNASYSLSAALGLSYSASTTGTATASTNYRGCN